MPMHTALLAHSSKSTTTFTETSWSGGLAPPSISAAPNTARPPHPGPAAPLGRRPSGLLGSNHPHGEELRPTPVRLSKRPAHPVDLMLAGQPAHLQRRLEEPQHARRTDRVGRQHATRAVPRDVAALD